MKRAKALLVVVVLILDLLGMLGMLHPRKCPACQRPYHRGQACDWSAVS